MIPITSAQLAEFSGAHLIGDTTSLVGADVVIDSRAVSPGALFAAVVGEVNDGHDYIAQAVAAGAAAVLVAHEVSVAVPQLVVPDVVSALSRLARAVVATAKTDGLKVLALTGSSGKTSTKDMLAQILEPVGATVSPLNSLNNATGMPLTALRVMSDTKFLVSEMGASHVGEIAEYAKVVQPDVAAVLNVGLAHLGEFGSREHIAAAKAEMIQAVEPDGWAVLNLDDPLVAAMVPRRDAHVAWFSATDANHERSKHELELCVQVKNLSADALGRNHFVLQGWSPTGTFEFPVVSQFAGAHMATNAAAAAALALAVGVTPERVHEGLNAARPRSRWRMELHQLTTGTLIINDAYNANPLSVQAALHMVENLKKEWLDANKPARVSVVLGDMLELGAESAALHYETGRQVVAAGVDTVIAVGSHASDIAQGVAAAHSTAQLSDAAATSKPHSRHISVQVVSKDDVSALLPHSAADIILLKGSRSVGLQAVADSLIARFGEVTL
ncbi:MAG: UDP-N-acetylmuramoyl-tripeptide--D-alanyl-D-alanine ligase [Propionibacteriaceae bacterium]|jgi:UDP-N-acetylmuramoyl-tripeptide--D-alanyl-D-alanine ligase|nr:UDP-N-acetylmuramoyl-tripeptide--D-alanyl-D-alanine ligase [Propionibacteriaceae bacterium]